MLRRLRSSTLVGFVRRPIPSRCVQKHCLSVDHSTNEGKNASKSPTTSKASCAKIVGADSRPGPPLLLLPASVSSSNIHTHDNNVVANDGAQRHDKPPLKVLDELPDWVKSKYDTIVKNTVDDAAVTNDGGAKPNDKIVKGELPDWFKSKYDTVEEDTKDDEAVTKDDVAVTKDAGAVTKDDGAVTKDDGAVTKDDGACTKDAGPQRGVKPGPKFVDKLPDWMRSKYIKSLQSDEDDGEDEDGTPKKDKVLVKLVEELPNWMKAKYDASVKTSFRCRRNYLKATSPSGVPTAMDILRGLRSTVREVELDDEVATNLIKSATAHDMETIFSCASRETIGKEVSMASFHIGFSNFFSLLASSGLYNIVFGADAFSVNQIDASVRLARLAQQSINEAIWHGIAAQRYVICLASVLLPLMHFQKTGFGFPQKLGWKPRIPRSGKPRESFCFARNVLRRQLKRPKKVTDIVLFILYGTSWLLAHPSLAAVDLTSIQAMKFFQMLRDKWAAALYLSHVVRKFISGTPGENINDEFERFSCSQASNVLRWNDLITGHDLKDLYEKREIALALNLSKYLFTVTPNITKEEMMKELKEHKDFTQRCAAASVIAPTKSKKKDEDENTSLTKKKKIDEDNISSSTKCENVVPSSKKS